MGLDQESLTTNTALANPTTIPLPVPQAGSPALNNDGGYLSYTDFQTDPRDGPWKGTV